MTSRHFLLAALVPLISLGISTLNSTPVKAAPFTTRETMIPFEADGDVLQLDSVILTPDGPGRFPLAVISHGSPRRASERARMSPTRYSDLAQWLAAQGFAVIIPMRRGYGKSQGTWAEGYGSCQNPDYTKAGLATAQDIQAVIAYMREQAYVDAKHIVLVGHSAGAWGSLAASSESPQGVVGAVLFAPGRGSLTPDRVCGGGNLVAAAGRFGRTAQVPTLWIYSENDHFFGPTLAREVYDAFRSTSHSQAVFLEEPSCGNDGHFLSRRCPDLWHASVATFLKMALSHN